MKNGDARVGVAWKEPVEGAPDRSKLALMLSAGIFGQIPCRVVENPRREDPKAPSHLIFHTPFEGKDLRVGALWPHTSKTSGAEYLLGQVDPRAFGELEILGGVKIDCRRVADPVGVRLSANNEPKSDRSPTHYLWRLQPIPKDRRAAAAVESSAGEAEGTTDLDLPPVEEEAVEPAS